LLMAGAGGEHYIAGTEGFHADAIRAAGGEPVGPEQDRYVPIDAEALIKLNPDMILTAGSPDAIVNDPRLKSMSAIAKLKVRGIPQDFATRMGFRVDREINMMGRALAEMSRIN
jgi:ABC-type hemin transport system substrate-binding protein